MYILLLTLVLIAAIISYKCKILDNSLSLIVVMIMTFMVSFRYGQGSDYYNYKALYLIQTWTTGISYTKEILFGIIIKLCVKYGVDYIYLVGVVGVFCMFFAYRGIQKLSKNKTISLLILLPTFYFTYFFSAMREGIVLAAFLGIVLPMILERKHKVKIAIIILILSLIHQSSIIMMLMLFDAPVRLSRKLMIIVSVGGGVGLWVMLQYVSIGIHELYYSPSYNALLIRVIMFALVTVLYDRSEKKTDINKMYDIYLIGFCLYLLTFSAALFSQRGTAYFKIIEVILIPNMMTWISPISQVDCRNTTKNTILAIIAIICMVEGVKNMASYPRQMGYVDGVTYYNYPYLSVYDKTKERIYKDD